MEKMKNCSVGFQGPLKAETDSGPLDVPSGESLWVLHQDGGTMVYYLGRTRTLLVWAGETKNYCWRITLGKQAIPDQPAEKEPEPDRLWREIHRSSRGY